MSKNSNLLLAIGLLLAITVFALFRRGEHRATLPSAPSLASATLPALKTQPDPRPPAAEPVDAKAAFTRPARTSNLTPDERAALVRNFSEKMKPAVEKWCKIYQEHVPFSPDEFTLDKFRERVGTSSKFYLYTFLLGDITLTIQDSGGRVVVNYMATRQLRHMAGLPKEGNMPILTPPIERGEIIQMLDQDAGVQLDPKLILIGSTSTGTSLNGGAFVDVGEGHGNALWPPQKLSLIFGPDGKLVEYLRDPFF